MRHLGLWMLIACLLPLVLLFALPAMYVRSDRLFAVPIVACLAVHLLMMRWHGHGLKGGKREDDRG